MAHLLRGKQAGVQRDLSSGLVPDLFASDNVARYGINSQIGALAYDPVQSLLAVGTKESQFGPGKVYVYGRQRICVEFSPSRPASIEKLYFAAEKLLVLDSRNDLTIYDLNGKKVVACYAPPGRTTAVAVDPSLDFALIGMANGEIIAYDLDRRGPAPFRMPNLLREFQPRARPEPIIALALHPRDVGTLLVGYPSGCAIYSFKQSKATAFLHYELPPGAPGGYADPSTASGSRHPRLVHLAWHPSGTFILTAHDDESFVIWDAKTAKIVQARTIQSTNVNRAGSGGTRGPAGGAFGSTPGTFAIKAPIFKVSWCCKGNPDDTGILVAGGIPMNVPDRGLTFLDLGATPVYATSSWQALSDHFEKPKITHTLPTPPNIDVVDFVLIPRASPHFNGACDPIAVIALTSSGELVALSFPSGHPIQSTNQLHPSLSFVAPFVNGIAVSSVDRIRWLGMVEKRNQGPQILKGGAEGTHPLKRFEGRNVIQTAHADGTVRLWDAGHGDEIENQSMLQADVARAVGRKDGVSVTKMSISGASGELAVGLRSGEVVIFRWERNQNKVSNGDNLGMEDIQGNADPALKEGLLPLTMFAGVRSPCTALKMSDVGFIAAGFEDGTIAVIDLRGPAVVYKANLTELGRPAKRNSLIRRQSTAGHAPKHDWPTFLNFSVMSLEEESYSSILLFVGTKQGVIATLKLLPSSNGAYTVQPAGVTNVDDAVIFIAPLNADTGLPASASQEAVASLRDGGRINGVILAVHTTGARIFKPATAKGASRIWEGAYCDSAGVCRDSDSGAIGLVGLFGDGTFKSFSIPNLKEISSQRMDKVVATRRLSEGVVTPSGDCFVWIGPSELAVVNPWGAGVDSTASVDKLYNLNAVIPPRPTISNLAWISGTQYVTPADLDVLIGGPDRPPSKRMLEQMRADGTGKQPGPSDAVAAGQQPQGWGEYMSGMASSIQQRTENLNILGDSMDTLEKNSANFSNDVSKYVKDQKKKAVMGFIGSKFGL